MNTLIALSLLALVLLYVDQRILLKRLSGAASTPASGCLDREAVGNQTPTDIPARLPRCLDKGEQISVPERFNRFEAWLESEDGRMSIGYIGQGDTRIKAGLYEAYLAGINVQRCFAARPQSEQSEGLGCPECGATMLDGCALTNPWCPTCKKWRPRPERASGRGND